ncbi:hypothetical protein NMY22_g17426 [Coprinellus aureogranulatus]|nr:hypothetical protein NMY22_g17426 [Coprinellus aureogranulatus]
MYTFVSRIEVLPRHRSGISRALESRSDPDVNESLRARVCLGETPYQAPRDFWTCLARLQKLEVVIVTTRGGFALPLLEELGARGDGVSSNTANTFPSLRVVQFSWCWAPSDSIYEDIGLATSGEADVEENVGRILQAFTKQGRRRTVDELKLVFHAQLELRDTALLRGVLRRLQEAAIATRIGVWDINGELNIIMTEDKALKMNERRMAQRDLEARIQELELELCRLKRIRNALLPISQLPPELLCEILSFDALTLANDDCESPPPNPVPKILNFCHVSHLWRTIIFGSPKCGPTSGVKTIRWELQSLSMW